MANILIVTWHGDPFTEQIYEGLRCIKVEGHELYLLSDEGIQPPTGLFERHFVIDLHNFVDVLRYLRQQNIRFHAVARRASEWLTPLVALITQEYGLIGNTVRTAFHCRSKYHMRVLLEREGIPVPRFNLCKNFDNVKTALSEFGGDCVIKPIGADSSYGTFFVKKGTDLEIVRDVYNHSIDYLKRKSIKGNIKRYLPEELELLGVREDINMVSDYLVEEFIPGTVVSINGIVQNGQATILLLDEEIRMPLPYFVQLADRMPYMFSAEMQAQLEDLHQRIATAFEIENSPTHIEVIIRPDNRVYVCEVAFRIGGDNLHDAVLQITGYNFMYEAVKIALGETRNYSTRTKCHIAAQYLLPDTKGRVKWIHIPDAIRNNPMITEIYVSVKPGDVIAPPPEDFDFVGYVQAKGNTQEEAAQNLEQALALVKIELET